jgi:subtilisin family serine protease
MLPTVLVAVIDSGIDGGHPEFADKIAAARSFVGGSALSDTQGHGTFVAGEIAAALDNGQGIAGIAFPAKLLVAKIVSPDGTIPLEAEAAAIRWATDQGARVINLSLAGLRDPLDASRDSYSQLEADAVDYAVRHGVLVVAAVGNSDNAPTVPWNYASYPAALPHVLGVSGLSPDGSVPSFSDRDLIYNDLAAPAVDIFSTFPRALTAANPTCLDQGYSDCATSDYQTAQGTSFAAPQVAAAAALLFAVNPALSSDQVSYLLERSATDMTAATGCLPCSVGRDALTGWGRLNITAALQSAQTGPIPPADRYEPNDDAASHAWTLYGRTRTIHATLDYWDDRRDVYLTNLHARQYLSIGLHQQRDASTSILLWRPGTQHVDNASPPVYRRLLATSVSNAGASYLGYRASTPGWYDVEVEANAPTPRPTNYLLTITKSTNDRQPTHPTA